MQEGKVDLKGIFVFPLDVTLMLGLYHVADQSVSRLLPTGTFGDCRGKRGGRY
jgi:hypothetical protein